MKTLKIATCLFLAALVGARPASLQDAQVTSQQANIAPARSTPVAASVGSTPAVGGDHLTPGIADNRPAAAAASGGLTPAALNDSSAPDGEEQQQYETFRRSRYFVPLFDEQTRSIPANQKEFQVRATQKELVLFREILREAIERRNRFAPSAQLVLKYSGRLLADLVRGRREEMALRPRKEPAAGFFRMLAELVGAALDGSGPLRARYSKASVDTEQLRSRVEAVMSQVVSSIEASPVGGYLRWNEMSVVGRPVADEAADLVAQFRVLGYEGAVFIGRRIANLLNMFARGQLPSGGQSEPN